MKRLLLSLMLGSVLSAGCAPVDLNAPVPVFDTGVDPDAWVSIPAGSFHSGRHESMATTAAYEIMVTDVTVRQYATFLTAAAENQSVTIAADPARIVGYYPGDVFRAVKHEERIDAGDWTYITLDDPAQKIASDHGPAFGAKPGFEDHPMTMVTWFGARGYCDYYGWRLPTELEWEKAGRGSADTRPFPWGEDIFRNHANFYSSRDPFEAMSSAGSRTTPVGFYNGRTYEGYVTMDSASPYGLYDMAGNVWQWTGDVHEGMHYRFLRGGSKDTYEMDLRIWVRNNATPTYASPGVGFRCAR